MLRGGETVTNAEKDAKKHRVGEAAGEGVLLAGVIGAEKAGEISGELVNRTVAEREGREGCDEAAIFEDLEIRAKGDAAEEEDGSGTQDFEFGFEIRAAIMKLGRKRLVRGRRAAK